MCVCLPNLKTGILVHAGVGCLDLWSEACVDPSALFKWWPCRDWRAHVPARDSAPGWSWLVGMPTWCFQGKPDILFFNHKISSSIKYTWKCVWVCQLEVSCDTPKGGLWAAPWRLPSRDSYLPWHSRIIILLLWHFLIKNKTFLTWTDKILCLF